jgi:endonuclease III related protein
LISIPALYKKLLRFHGPQGWWPIIDLKSGISVYKPRLRYNENEKFEIFIGAILTQGIAWKNVEKAIHNLKKEKCLDPASLNRISHEKLGVLIKPTGYFNQKANKVKNFIKWFSQYNYLFSLFNKIPDIELRKNLLSINGIGPETADSMLNYGLGRKIFVVDAYTKRILSRLGYIDESQDYHSVQNLFHKILKPDAQNYKEFHSLFVVHGSIYCKKTPLCNDCPLSSCCKQKSS